MQDPNCSAAKAVEAGDETFYECTDKNSPCYQNLCDTEMCLEEDDYTPVNKKECLFKDYYGVCQNDDIYNHGDYCPGHCDFFESK